MFANAVLMPVARVFIPTVAANATLLHDGIILSDFLLPLGDENNPFAVFALIGADEIIL
jgi:hypothetical protein